MRARAPNPRERGIAYGLADRIAEPGDLGAALLIAAVIRDRTEEVLEPFEALVRDYDAVGDERLASELAEVIATVRREA